MEAGWQPDPRRPLLPTVVLVGADGHIDARVVQLNRPGGGHVWAGTIERGPRVRHETGPCETEAAARAAVVELLAGRRRRYVAPPPRRRRYGHQFEDYPGRPPPHPGTTKRPPR